MNCDRQREGKRIKETRKKRKDAIERNREQNDEINKRIKKVK